MRWPSSMPAGTSIFSVLSSSVRPRPSQRSHGCSGHAAVAVADVALDLADDLAERRAGHALQPARAAAALAGLDRRARLGAVAVALRAALDRLELDLDLGLLGDVGELELDRRAMSPPPRGPAAPAAEDAAAPAAEERVEDVRQAAERARSRSGCSRRCAGPS
jgi:hypothetical protein